jgi:hypothetical protein
MSVALSDLTKATFLGGLGTLQSVIDAAEKHADGDAVADLLKARLVDDMFDFVQQVQAATDTARRVTDRLAEREPTGMPDPERTLEALRERIAQTIAHIQAADEAAIDTAVDRVMTIDLGAGPMKFTGRSYFLGFAMPNFLFHVTTAYDILRHRGVELGKVDFIRPFVGATMQSG